MTKPLCFIDTETTSLDPRRRRAWEVAMVRRETDGTESRVAFLVDVDLSDADPFALNVGRFYERHPVGVAIANRQPFALRHDALMDEREAAHAVAEYTHGATLVGSNPAFDAETLAALLREYGLVPSWSHRLRDVATLVSGSLGRDVGGLDGALEALLIAGPDAAKRHTAMADALAAMNVYDHVMGATP